MLQFRAALSGLVVSVLVLSLKAVQVPLGARHRWQDGNQAILNENDLTESWNLDELPNPNNTDHLVFETVHSLLQHWPNTRIRNGHSIVPGIIPKGTLLYHATNGNELPSSPEWVATDPEHSHTFCVDRVDRHFQQTCQLFTLATTRPLKVIYFDGTSAANMPTGTMDTQELFIWGRIKTGTVKDEPQLIQDLCEWGENFGVGGFVRMEMDFEIMLCDFTSGISLVSNVNLLSRGALHVFVPGFITFEVIDAGSWHNRFPGETRIKLDLAGLVSFYDTQLVPSLVSIRADQERWDHRVQNTSSQDLATLKSRLEGALIRPSGLPSGIDWKTLIQVIVDRYGGRLELTRHLLNSSTTDQNEILDLANKIQSQLRIMLTPYLLFSATPTDPLNKADLDWTIPIYRLCTTTHTYFIESELDSMTESEKSLLRAVRATSREICRVVTKMWVAGVYVGLDPLLNTKEFPDITDLNQARDTWAEDLNRLMTWLDWNVWVKCNPHCGPEELCYLPTWPVGLHLSRGGPRLPSSLGPERAHLKKLTGFDVRTMITESLAEDVWNNTEPIPDGWRRPQPRCIRRVAPKEF